MITKIDKQQLGLKRYKIPKDQWKNEVETYPIPIEAFGKDWISAITFMVGYSTKKKHWRNTRITLNRIRTLVLECYEVDILDLPNKTRELLKKLFPYSGEPGSVPISTENTPIENLRRESPFTGYSTNGFNMSGLDLSVGGICELNTL